MPSKKGKMDSYVRQLQDIDRRIRQLDIQKEDADMERRKLQYEKAKVEGLIDAFFFCVDGVRVSEHAVLRYLERVRNIDINLIVEEMLSAQGITDRIKTIGSGLIPVGGGNVMRVIDSTVVTIFNKEKKDEQ